MSTFLLNTVSTAILLVQSQSTSFSDLVFQHTTIEDFNSLNMEIGWIQFGSCTEGCNEMTQPDWCTAVGNNHSLIYPNGWTKQEMIDVSKYAITVKILPSTDIPGSEDAEYAITADICSNPIYALNNGCELSYTLNLQNLSIEGVTNLSYWIGSDNAKNRMTNSCVSNGRSPGSSPTSPLLISDGHFYFACGNGNGVHITTVNDYGVVCYLDYSHSMGHNISIWVGFDINKTKMCQLQTFEEYALSTIDPQPSVSPSRTPTEYPTLRPTVPPTPNPSQSPVKPGNPSRAPSVVSSSPTLPPSFHPTPLPTNTPTKRPTKAPSNTPTPKPTSPAILSCGDQLSGDYNDEALVFDVNLPYDGYLTFDASSSNFVIHSLTAVFGTTPIASDTDYDGILTLSNVFAAVYHFTVQGANGKYDRFDVSISCQSNEPTLAPSKGPTPDPTLPPTPAPTQPPTKRPTDAPIKPGSPTHAPTLPTPLPTRSPTLYPTVRPSDTPTTPSPTEQPTESPTTPPPTQPGIISCDNTISGAYNNAPISFQVHMPSTGNLQFDASNSFPLTITSLSAVLGVKPIGFDSDMNGILDLEGINAGVYTFTLIAEPGTNQRYRVEVSCVVANPTSLPTKAPQFPITLSPTEFPSVVIPQSTRTISSTRQKQYKTPTDEVPLIVVMWVIIAAVVVVVFFIVYLVHLTMKTRMMKQQTHVMSHKDDHENKAHHKVGSMEKMLRNIPLDLLVTRTTGGHEEDIDAVEGDVQMPYTLEGSAPHMYECKDANSNKTNNKNTTKEDITKRSTTKRYIIKGNTTKGAAVDDV